MARALGVGTVEPQPEQIGLRAAPHGQGPVVLVLAGALKSCPSTLVLLVAGGCVVAHHRHHPGRLVPGRRRWVRHAHTQGAQVRAPCSRPNCKRRWATTAVGGSPRAHVVGLSCAPGPAAALPHPGLLMPAQAQPLVRAACSEALRPVPCRGRRPARRTYACTAMA